MHQHDIDGPESDDPKAPSDDEEARSVEELYGVGGHRRRRKRSGRHHRPMPLSERWRTAGKRFKQTVFLTLAFFLAIVVTLYVLNHVNVPPTAQEAVPPPEY